MATIGSDMEKNTLVLYKTQLAIVCDFEQDKILINYQGQDKKHPTLSQKVRQKDIVILDKRPATNIEDALREVACNFSEGIKEAWELLCDEPCSTPLEQLGEIVIGKDYSSLKSWSLYCQLSTSLYFALDTKALALGSISFLPRTISSIQELKQKQEQKANAMLQRQEFIKRLKARKLNLKTDATFMQDVEALALGTSDKSRTLSDAGISQTQEAAHRVLLETRVWSYFKNPYPSRYGVSLQGATENLASPIAEERLNVECISYAIDAKDSTDPDDAIGYDGKYIWVHVADPASTVTPDSKIDIMARGRGATLYIPEGTARMLSESCLADYALGLKPLSQALSFRIKLDSNAQISECEVFKTTVTVKRLSYEEAQAQKETSELKPLFEIAQKLLNRRLKAGATIITMPEVAINIVDNEVEISPHMLLESNILVREMMLLAGEAAAKFAFSHSIPFPYISQAAPENLPTKLAGLAGEYRKRRSMKARNVGVSPSAHTALGLSMYSQVTSPLRRYGDLVSHQQLRNFITKKPLIDKDSMLERISAGDAASKSVIMAERKTRLHWTLVYLLQHKDWSGDAIVVELRQKQVQCIIPSLAFEFTLQKEGVALNDIIRVKPRKINLADLLVSFTEI